MYEVTRKNLEEEEVLTLLYSLDSSFASQLQEKVNLEEYSRKLSANAFFEVARLENIIVGVIAFYINVETSNLYVPYVCVHSAYRHKGIADMLMTDLCHYADSRNVEISLEVRKCNRGAIRLYEKFGFQTVGDNGIKLYMTRK